MKKLSLIILFVIIPITSFCQTYFSFTKCINNYWGEWEYSNPYKTIDGGYLLNGTYDEFIIYAYDKHPRLRSKESRQTNGTNIQVL